MRTTYAAVIQTIKTSLTETQVLQYGNDAALWVDEELLTANLSTARLEMIERYLTCALIRLRDLGLAQVHFEDVWEYYQVDPEVTDYLIRAASFDPTGKLRQCFLADKARRSASGLVGRGFADDC